MFGQVFSMRLNEHLQYFLFQESETSLSVSFLYADGRTLLPAANTRQLVILLCVWLWIVMPSVLSVKDQMQDNCLNKFFYT